MAEPEHGGTIHSWDMLTPDDRDIALGVFRKLNDSQLSALAAFYEGKGFTDSYGYLASRLMTAKGLLRQAENTSNQDINRTLIELINQDLLAAGAQYLIS